MHTVEMAAVAVPEALDAEAIGPGARAALPLRRTALLVAAGGALGAVLRYALEATLPTLTQAALIEVPWTTLAVNIAGCLGIGGLSGLVEVRRDLPAWVQPFLGTGLLAGFTTMALAVLQVSAMIGADVPLLALEYAAASALLPVAAAVLGLLLGRVLGGRRARPRGRA